jgi:hypothetical protein
MFGFILCFAVSVVEWFMVSKRTVAITQSTPWVGIIVAAEVALGLGAGYVIFVQQNFWAAVGCALGAGLGAELARK